MEPTRGADHELDTNGAEASDSLVNSSLTPGIDAILGSLAVAIGETTTTSGMEMVSRRKGAGRNRETRVRALRSRQIEAAWP